MKNNERSIIIIIFFVTILFFQLPAYANNGTNTISTNNSENVYKPSSRERFIFYSERGQEYYDTGFYEIATQFFKRALILKPGDVNMLVNSGLANMAIGHFHVALTHFENALELKPNDQKIDNYRRDALWLIKVQEGEIPDLEHTLPIQATTAKGIELYYDGHFEESLEMLNRSLENIPYELKALIVGGHALVELERYVEAIDYYDRALSINPKDESVSYSKKTATELLSKETSGSLHVDSISLEEQKRTEREMKRIDLEKEQKELLKEKDSQNNKKLIIIEDLKNIQQNPPSIKSNNSINNTKSTVEVVSKVTSKTINQTVDQIIISEFSSERNERLDSAIEGIPDRAATVVKKTAICAGTLCFLENEDQNEILLDYTIQVDPQISSSLNYYIPTDTKDISEVWLEGSINNTEFLTSTTYFIREQGKTRMISFEILKSSENIDEFLIPDWLKNNVFWWINGYISDQDFINGLEYLINAQIIKLSLIKTKIIGS